MSKNRNRAKLNKAFNNKEYYKLLWDDLYGTYWEEGINFYPKYRAGFKNPNKQIYSYQIRMYKTWKYNRKFQYKTKN